MCPDCNRQVWPLIEERDSIQPVTVMRRTRRWHHWRIVALLTGPREPVMLPVEYEVREYTPEQRSHLAMLERQADELRRQCLCVESRN